MGSTARSFNGQHKIGIQLSGLTGLQIIASFAIQWYVVTKIGAGIETDALYTGAAFPATVTVLLIESISPVLVPLLSSMPESELEDASWMLTLVLAVIFGAISIILWLLIPFMVPLLVPGFSAAAKAATIRLAKIQVVALVGGACAAPIVALCQVRGKFLQPAFATLFGLIVGVFLLWFGLGRVGITVAAWSQVIATCLPPFLLAHTLGYVRRPRLNREMLTTIVQRAKPLVLSKTYYMVSVPVDRFLASFLAPGSIVILELAGRFYSAVLRVLSQGILTPFLPTLSRLAKSEDWKEFRAVNRRQIVYMVVPSMLVVVTVGVGAWIARGWALAHPGMKLTGNLTTDNVALIFLILLYMSGLVPCASISNALISAYYAQGDTRTPARVGVQVFTFGFVLKIAGYYFGGLGGMALAVTLWAFTQTTILGYMLTRRTNQLASGQLSTPTTLAAAAAAGAVAADPLTHAVSEAQS
jgi:putative peptidoglycan lipid II flippase